MPEDIKILRKLAYEFSEIAYGEKNIENKKLHTAVNDLKQIRPVVLINELPWHEMNINDELTLYCTDAYSRNIEFFFRSAIFKNKHFPADMVVPQFLPIQKEVRYSSIGIEVKEDVLSTDKTNHIVSHAYKDLLENEEDLDKLQIPKVYYLEKETMDRYNMIGEMIGDILPVKITGIGFFNVTPWDDIARYRGVTNLLIDLAERPDFMHKIVRKLTDINLSLLKQYEKLDLFDNNFWDLHCTPFYTKDLPGKSFNGESITRKNIWGRGAAQIFSSVSKEMHEEFDIDYMKETIGRCGLSYYGCCEPLDKKIDIVEKIPNLRKISITPWADVNIAAEAINTKYVLSSKPNPASVAVPVLDKDELKKEISKILNACRKNNCSCDIVLKDISTCSKNPQNIFEWEKTVMEMVKN